jgi:hypothetical protein
MRIVTRPDFDGIVCAALLYDALDVKQPVLWVTPGDMQKKNVPIKEGDIIANLPYHPECELWFDHHHSNRIGTPFGGLFMIAPSAAGLVFEYYRTSLKRDYRELITATDKIDSADLNMDEILHPQKYPYIWLSMTVNPQDPGEISYWNHLIDLLRTEKIFRIMSDPRVKKRCARLAATGDGYKTDLLANTRVEDQVAITDFRNFNKIPDGNRFLVYSLFPEVVVAVKIRYQGDKRQNVAVNVGHSIVNRNCAVNVGELLSRFEGGGHRGAGACTFAAEKANDYIPKILDALKRNQPL